MTDNLDEMENELQNMVDALDSENVSMGDKQEELESIIQEIQGQLEFLQEQVNHGKS